MQISFVLEFQRIANITRFWLILAGLGHIVAAQTPTAQILIKSGQGKKQMRL